MFLSSTLENNRIFFFSIKFFLRSSSFLRLFMEFHFDFFIQYYSTVIIWNLKTKFPNPLEQAIFLIESITNRDFFANIDSFRTNLIIE